MDPHEYTLQTHRTARYNSILAAIEKTERATEALKFDKGTLELDVGDGIRTHFDTFARHEIEPFRNALREILVSRAFKLRKELAEI